jgi:hypothetical protein
MLGNTPERMMTHRASCPRPWEARQQGERDFNRFVPSWENPYQRKPFEWDHCREAERAWEDGRRQAERRYEEEVAARRMAGRRREEQEWARIEEEAYYARREEDAQYQQWCDEQMAAAEAEHYFWMEQDELLDRSETV